MDLEIKGKHAVVTGGTHGIGLAIANQLESEGCRVSVCSRSTGVNVLKPEAIKDFMTLVGDVDILINNVGGGGRWGQSFEDTAEDVWRDVYDKNAMAAVRFTKLALPHMRRQKWGRVITITSVYGREGGGKPWFNMAKCAETSLMKTLSMNKDFARDGITFNSVAPGAIKIPGTGWDDASNEFIESLPLGRLGLPEEVANVVSFLCSTKASLVSGASIAVDGSESKSF